MASSSEKERIIENEISILKEKIPPLPDLQLVTCVPEQIRVHLSLTQYKQMSICMQFPEKYPQAPLLIELKSKTLTDQLLDRLSKICEEEIKRHVGQKQVLILVKFLRQFILDNPLCCCSDEISYVKRHMVDEGDDLKIKQKNSQILLNVKKNKYFMNLRISVPDDYPKECVKTEVLDSNFPKLLRINFHSQGEEVARRCVQPPIKKNQKGPAFTPQPSLRKVCQHLVKDCVKRYPEESCPLCGEKCLPDDPQTVTQRRKTVIRVYCGHIFHFICMDTYMKTPPFTGGKKCPSCDNRIFHEQWSSSPELLEMRWAHKEARARELDEVVDFLK